MQARVRVCQVVDEGIRTRVDARREVLGTARVRDRVKEPDERNRGSDEAMEDKL